MWVVGGLQNFPPPWLLPVQGGHDHREKSTSRSGQQGLALMSHDRKRLLLATKELGFRYTETRGHNRQKTELVQVKKKEREKKQNLV